MSRFSCGIVSPVQAIPFVYELRALLDWSCTATTLSLFDWFKLEDINTSLYFVAVTRDGRERRVLGERQPRYLKFLQVGSALAEENSTCRTVSDCVHTVGSALP